MARRWCFRRPPDIRHRIFLLREKQQAMVIPPEPVADTHIGLVLRLEFVKLTRK